MSTCVGVWVGVVRGCLNQLLLGVFVLFATVLVFVVVVFCVVVCLFFACGHGIWDSKDAVVSVCTLSSCAQEKTRLTGMAPSLAPFVNTWQRSLKDASSLSSLALSLQRNT